MKEIIFNWYYLLLNIVMLPLIVIGFFNSVQTPRFNRYIPFFSVSLSVIVSVIVLYNNIVPKAIITIFLNAVLFLVIFLMYKDKVINKFINTLVYLVLNVTFDLLCSTIVGLNKNLEVYEVQAYSYTFVLVMFALAFNFAQKFINSFKNNLISKKGFIFLLIPLSHVIMLSVMGATFGFASAKNDYMLSYFTKISIPLSVSMSLSVILGFAVDILAFNQYIKNINMIKLEEQNIALEKINALNTQYFNDLKDKENELRKIKHDINGSLEVVKELMYESKNTDKAEQLFNDITKISHGIQTGFYSNNCLINAVIVNKEKVCKENAIDFTVSANVPEPLFVLDTDVCRAMVNMLDNAIEAAQRCENVRFVELSIKEIDDELYIKTVNSFKGLTLSEETIKHNAEEHGFGKKILTEIAERYDGNYSIKEENDTVVALMVLKNRR